MVSDRVAVMGRQPRRVINAAGSSMPLTKAADKHHFQVVQAGTTSVFVRAGPAIRLAAGTKVVVAMGVDGPATSTSYDSYLTLTGITTTTHIVTDLDDAITPTTLTASSTGSGAYPSGETTLTRRVLAKVTCAAGVITAIEQYERGAWLDFWAQPDGVSLGYQATDKDLEINGYQAVAAETPWPSGGEVQGRPADPADPPFWSSPYDLVGSFSDWSGITIDGATLANVACIWDHDDLLDVAAGTCGDDHNALGADSGNYPYVSPRGDATRVGNRFLANTCLADAAGEDAVKPNERQLIDTDGSTIIADWAAHQIYFDDGGLAIDWDTTDVVQIPDTVQFQALDTTDMTDADDAAIYTPGGIEAEQHIGSHTGFKIQDGTNNLWTATTLLAGNGESYIDVSHTVENNIGIVATGALVLTFGSLNIMGYNYTLTECNVDIGGVSTPCVVPLRVL